MATSFEELRVLKAAEAIADEIWQLTAEWESFPREVVGKQLARAADSIGANIAEAYGRFHFGEKLQFLYYARGSLFETKYWLNRASTRRLLPEPAAQAYAERLSELARQLNRFASHLKHQRTTERKSPSQLSEPSTVYTTTLEEPIDGTIVDPLLFTPDNLTFIEALTGAGAIQSPISNQPISGNL